MHHFFPIPTSMSCIVCFSKVQLEETTNRLQELRAHNSELQAQVSQLTVLVKSLEGQVSEMSTCSLLSQSDFWSLIDQTCYIMLVSLAYALQIGSLEGQRQSLEATMLHERRAAKDGVCKLETQLQQLQQTLMVKVQECSSSKEAYHSLKMEIEAFKLLLGEEEKR